MSSQGAASIELSMIIPTYNERENLIPLVESIHRALSDLVYELIVVDDDSPDGTAELAQTLAQEYPIKVIRRKNERGLATAVVEGFRQAIGKVLGVIDADLQHPPELIPDLLREIHGGADIAIATRYIEGGGTSGWGLGRKIISQGAKGLAYVLLPATRKIKDPLSGFFLLKREVIDGVKLMPTGYKILLEVLVRGRANEVVAVPYTFVERARGDSKLSFKEELSYLKHIWQLSEARTGATRFAKFCAVGISGVFVNMGLLWLLTNFAGFYYLFSAIFAIEASILSNFILNEIWTFRDRRAGGIKSIIGRALKFNLVCSIGVGLNMAVLYGLTEFFGVYYLVSNLVGIAVATLWNYGLSNFWTWRRK
jgi:dolichol-phosphate mannosyltransferase